MEPICPALLVSVGNFTHDDDRAIALAQQVVARRLGAKWTVISLGKGARDYRVERASRKNVPVGEAWEITRRLLRDRDVFDAEPELVGPGLEPHPDERADLIEAGLARASGLDGPALECTNPPSYDWSLSLCKVQKAWRLPIPNPVVGRARGEGIVVGHPDTGYTRHAEIWNPDLAKNRLMWHDGHNFFDRTDDSTDKLDGENAGHGTATASVIMAGADCTSGDRVDGVAPMAKLVPLRVTNRVVLLNFGNLAEAIHYAVEKQCHVISISLGGTIRSRTLHRAVKRAVENGIVVLGAAGNVWPWVVYPARFDEVVAVAACNCEKKIWTGSASGPTVDVTAPGESVWVARAENKNGRLNYYRDRGSGTSFAVATAAGACALWLAFHGRDELIRKYGATNLAAVFKEMVMKSGVDMPPGWRIGDYGAGILNVEKLLGSELPATPHAAGTGVRANLAPSSVSVIDEIATFFPGVSRARVWSGIARFLHATESELPAILAEAGDEILFHVATNPLVRAEIGKMLHAPVAASPAMRERGAARLARTASRAIRARVGV
jgi:serine protease